MKTVHLHGHLKKKFGPSFKFDVETAGEALRALNAAFPGEFVEALRYGSYRVLRGKKRGGMDIEIGDINSFRLGNADLHIIPVAHGAANKGGTTKAILGVVLIGAAVFLSGGTMAAPLAGMSAAIPGLGGMVTWGNIAMLGVGLALSGVAASIASADASPDEAQDQKQSYTFSGPVNVNEQGSAVPLIYGGPMIVGSQPISAGFDIEDMSSYPLVPDIDNVVIRAMLASMGINPS